MLHSDKPPYNLKIDPSPVSFGDEKWGFVAVALAIYSQQPVAIAYGDQALVVHEDSDELQLRDLFRRPTGN